MMQITQLLGAIENGEANAGELLPLVYNELRRLARQRLAHEPPGQTLDATALVHEAYLRLVDADKQQHWDSRGHFFSAAAEAMRRILVETARRKKRRKHGGGNEKQELKESQIAAPEVSDDLLELDDALNRLAEKDRDAAELVTLRYFSGLTNAEAAKVLKIAPRTADRLWAFGRAWLRRELTKDNSD